MNTKLYTQVHSLAKGLLNAAEKENDTFFDQQYNELKSICEANEGGNKNHPVQWETLADFTEDIDDALAYYQKAFGFAKAIDAYDYMASIHFSMATFLSGQGKTEMALAAAQSAEQHASRNEDEILKQDIADLISMLT